MGAKEQYESRKAADEARRKKLAELPKKEPWWFRQPIPIDRFTGWLVAWTALLFVTGVISAAILLKTDHTLGLQIEALQRQLALMEADQRPWISDEIEAATDLTFDDKEGKISFLYKLKNIGKSPAFNLNAWPIIVPLNSIVGGPAAILQDHCEDMERKTKSLLKDGTTFPQWGTILYPTTAPKSKRLQQ